MYLHGLGILHGSISPVGEMENSINPYADVWCVQSNILITQDGQACLGDFAIAGAFVRPYMYYRSETLRYMAPERFSARGTPLLVDGSSKESDVYSVAMISFSVRTLLETILLLETTVPFQSGPHRGIAISWECDGYDHRYSCR